MVGEHDRAYMRAHSRYVRVMNSPHATEAEIEEAEKDLAEAARTWQEAELLARLAQSTRATADR